MNIIFSKLAAMGMPFLANKTTQKIITWAIVVILGLYLWKSISRYVKAFFYTLIPSQETDASIIAIIERWLEQKASSRPYSIIKPMAVSQALALSDKEFKKMLTIWDSQYYPKFGKKMSEHFAINLLSGSGYIDYMDAYAPAIRSFKEREGKNT